MKTIEPLCFGVFGYFPDSGGWCLQANSIFSNENSCKNFILFSDGNDGDWQVRPIYGPDAMERIKELEDENAELKAWKEEASQVFDDVKFQEVGAELGVPLGSRVAPNILPCIKAMKAENAELRRDADSWHRAFMALAEKEDK